jgi:hypothetical protein
MTTGAVLERGTLLDCPGPSQGGACGPNFLSRAYVFPDRRRDLSNLLSVTNQGGRGASACASPRTGQR